MRGPEGGGGLGEGGGGGEAGEGVTGDDSISLSDRGGDQENTTSLSPATVVNPTGEPDGTVEEWR